MLRLRRHPDPEVRQAIASLLCHGTAQQVAKPLGGMLRDDHEGVRAAAAKSLIAVVGCRRATPAILPMSVACQQALLAAASYAREDAVADWVLDQLRRHGDASLHAAIEAVVAERLLQ